MAKGRFDYGTIVARIEDMRTRKGITAKELIATLGLDSSRWYRKMRGEGSTFTLDEFGAIADALGAPRESAWPFADWEPRAS